MHVGVIAKPLVVIAREIADLRPFPGLAQNLLDNVVVALSPEPRLSQSPAVDDVAHEVEVFGFGVAQEVEEKIGLASAGSQMDVGDPDRAVAIDVTKVHGCSFTFSSPAAEKKDAL